MKLLCFLFISVVLSSTIKAQSKSITVGAGPSTSLWYWNGGPLQTWGTANINNVTEGFPFLVQFKNRTFCYLLISFNHPVGRSGAKA